MLVLTFYGFCKCCLTKLFRDKHGQTAGEYVMLIVLFAIAVFITSPSMIDAIIEIFQGTSSMLEDGMSA